VDFEVLESHPEDGDAHVHAAQDTGGMTLQDLQQRAQEVFRPVPQGPEPFIVERPGPVALEEPASETGSDTAGAKRFGRLAAILESGGVLGAVLRWVERPREDRRSQADETD
jgi:hypothetical protein